MKRILFKALGSKEGDTDKEADKVAMVRLLLVSIALITNVLISVNIIIGWVSNI